jgi:hypothetical protein
MNRSPLSDFNRRRSIFDSPNFVRFINKTLHSQSKPDYQLDSTTSSSSYGEDYSSKHRVAITRKLPNMNEQSPLQLNRGKENSQIHPELYLSPFRYYSIKSYYFR